MEWEKGDTTLCFYNKKKYGYLIETPEAMVKVVRICMQTLLPLCQEYTLDPEKFDSIGTIPKDDIVAIRFIHSPDGLDLPATIERKWEVFEEIMEWFIRKSHENPKMYKKFVEEDFLHGIDIQFTGKARSPYDTNFTMTYLRVILSQSLLAVIQKNLAKEGYPEDLFYKDEEFLAGMVASQRRVQMEWQQKKEAMGRK